MLAKTDQAVKAGTPMTVKGEGALSGQLVQGAAFFFFKISPPEALNLAPGVLR